MNTDQLLLDIRSDVEREVVGKFPIWAFPFKVQGIIMDLVTYQGFRIEYFATAMLSAAATIIGNSCKLEAEGSWVVPCSLYFILVGRPGLGKTPPIDAAFKPIRGIDADRLAKYKVEYELYRRSKESENPLPEPKFHQILVPDATIESLKQKLEINPNGVCDFYDELIAWFNSAARNNSSLIEDLLSIYSGTPIVVTRATVKDPIFVEHPCLNIIGTTQTTRVRELISKGLLDNGLLDRFQFAFPDNQKLNYAKDLEEWQRKAIADALEKWRDIIMKLVALTVEDSDGYIVPNYLTLTDEARTHFIHWWNHDIVDAVNAIEDEADVKSRTMKRNNNTYRMALVLQILRHVCGEADMQQVDITSIKSAIALNQFYEDCYDKIMALNMSGQLNVNEMKILDQLPQEFTSSQIQEVCVKQQMSERSVYDYLKRLQQWKLIRKVRHGVYQKI